MPQNSPEGIAAEFTRERLNDPVVSIHGDRIADPGCAARDARRLARGDRRGAARGRPASLFRRRASCCLRLATRRRRSHRSRCATGSRTSDTQDRNAGAGRPSAPRCGSGRDASSGGLCERRRRKTMGWPGCAGLARGQERRRRGVGNGRL